MKRLQISLEPELDDQLAAKALEEGVSKAELVRRSLRESIRPLPPIEEDPFFGAFGTVKSGGIQPGESIDEIVYGRKADPS